MNNDIQRRPKAHTTSISCLWPLQPKHRFKVETSLLSLMSFSGRTCVTYTSYVVTPHFIQHQTNCPSCHRLCFKTHLCLAEMLGPTQSNSMSKMWAIVKKHNSLEMSFNGIRSSTISFLFAELV